MLQNKIDPSLQKYLEWLSTNWAEQIEEEHHQPSSSSSWSPSSTWWSSSSWTSSWQRWHQHIWQDDQCSEQWRATQPRTRVFEEVERAFRKLLHADSNRQDQRCHHQPESLTAVLFYLDFSTEVAECEFRTQPVATAVSATVCIDTTPTSTRTDAHFSRAHISAQFTALFQCGHTALAQKESVLRISLHSFPSRLSCPCQMVRLVDSLQSRPQPRWVEVE